MRVRCISSSLTAAQTVHLGRAYHEQSYRFKPGRDYEVIGVAFFVDGPPYGTGCYFQLLSESDHLVFAPDVLFEVTDPVVPSSWEIRNGPGWCHMAPALLHSDFFQERFNNRESDARDALGELRSDERSSGNT